MMFYKNTLRSQTHLMLSWGWEWMLHGKLGKIYSSLVCVWTRLSTRHFKPSVSPSRRLFSLDLRTNWLLIVVESIFNIEIRSNIWYSNKAFSLRSSHGKFLRWNPQLKFLGLDTPQSWSLWKSFIWAVRNLSDLSISQDSRFVRKLTLLTVKHGCGSITGCGQHYLVLMTFGGSPCSNCFSVSL